MRAVAEILAEIADDGEVPQSTISAHASSLRWWRSLMSPRSLEYESVPDTRYMQRGGHTGHHAARIPRSDLLVTAFGTRTGASCAARIDERFSFVPTSLAGDCELYSDRLRARCCWGKLLMRPSRSPAIVTLTLVAVACSLSLCAAPPAFSATATPMLSATPNATATPSPGATPSPSAAADPLALLNAEIAARNRGDINAAIALFADNATFTTAACQPCTTRAGILDTLQHLLIDHWQITPFNNQVSGDAVTGKFTLTSDSIRARGFQRIIADESLTEENGRIVNYSSAPDSTDPQTMQFLIAASQPPGPPPTLPSTGVGDRGVVVEPRLVWAYAALAVFTVGALITGLGIRHRRTKPSSLR